MLCYRKNIEIRMGVRYVRGETEDEADQISDGACQETLDAGKSRRVAASGCQYPVTLGTWQSNPACLQYPAALRSLRNDSRRPGLARRGARCRRMAFLASDTVRAGDRGNASGTGYRNLATGCDRSPAQNRLDLV